MLTIGTVLNAMITYYAGDVRRINHFIKVYGYAQAIGSSEGLDMPTQFILEVAALTHDIGIKNSERRYNSSAGSYQQLEGPPEARRLLEQLGAEPSLIERVCWLIAHHHTYMALNDPDYRILIEADFIVNALEDSLSIDTIRAASAKIFRTPSGLRILHTVYPFD